MQLYAHIPFCEKKCHYCDFASWELPAARQAGFTTAFLAELRHRAAAFGGGPSGAALSTVFFGGGTPSVLKPAYLEEIVKTIKTLFRWEEGIEATLECNPGSLNAEKLALYRGLGFNRVSLGVQSFDAEELRLLGRAHDPEAARRALSLLREERDKKGDPRSAWWEEPEGASRDEPRDAIPEGPRGASKAEKRSAPPGRAFSFSADLIFGLPGQSPASFLANLDALLEFDPDHLSFYGLSFEPGTEFEKRRRKGEIRPAEAEVYNAMYEDGVRRLAAAGYERYEVSNFAKPGRECRHNQGYWNGAPYLALGPGAHSFDGAARTVNPRGFEEYLRWAAGGFSPADQETERLEAEARIAEAVFLALRQAEGLDLQRLARAEGFILPAAAWERWEKAGHLQAEGDPLRLRLQGEGWHLLDEIAADLLAKGKTRSPSRDLRRSG